MSVRIKLGRFSSRTTGASIPGPTVILPVMRMLCTAFSLAMPPLAAMFFAMMSSAVCAAAGAASASPRPNATITLRIQCLLKVNRNYPLSRRNPLIAARGPGAVERLMAQFVPLLRYGLLTLALLGQQTAPPGIPEALQIQQKDPAAAAKILEGVTAREPNNARAWRLLGVARHLNKEFARAIEAYEKAIAIQPDATATYNIGAALARLGNRDSAFEWLEKARAS